MSTSYLDNISQSKYISVPESSITNCLISPTGPVFENPTDTEHEDYEQSHSKWCDVCNNAYHRSCDDKMQTYSATYNLNLQKDSSDDILRLKSVCTLPILDNDILKLSLEEVKKLKQRSEHLSSDISECIKLRNNHHKNCVREKITNILGPDPGHKNWIKSLKRVQSHCQKSYNRLQRLRPGVASREKRRTIKLTSHTRLSLYKIKRKKSRHRTNKRYKKSIRRKNKNSKCRKYKSSLQR